MIKFTLKAILLSTICIFLSQTTLFADTYTHTITSKTWSAYDTQTLNGVDWNATATGGAYWGYDATKGQQFGSSANSASVLSLTSSGTYDIKDNHSRLGVAISLLIALGIIFLISNPFKGLIISQMILSIQLPITIFLQVYLTSSKKVMGKYVNSTASKIVLFTLGGIVTVLNIALFISFF